MQTRRILSKPAIISGITLFTAKPATLTIHPADPGTGICFRRVDLPGQPIIPALIDHVVRENRRTVLALDPSNPQSPSVQTTEHILSALAGLGITDARLDLEGIEIPIGDGSAKTFVDAILAAGWTELSSSPPLSQLALASPFVIEENTARIDFRPLAPGDAPGLYLTYELEYPPPPAPGLATLGKQSATLYIAPGTPSSAYITQIAPARTFSLAHEAQAMRQMGLFTHLTPKDMLVIGPDGPIENSYRFDFEPARHKLLDLLGDLSLSGITCTLSARITAHKAGHALNHELARRVRALL